MGQLASDVPSELSVTPPHKKNKNLIDDFTDLILSIELKTLRTLEVYAGKCLERLPGPAEQKCTVL
jgi:hypothetical protein